MIRIKGKFIRQLSKKCSHALTFNYIAISLSYSDLIDPHKPTTPPPANKATSMRWLGRLDITTSRPNGIITTVERPPRPHLTHLTQTFHPSHSPSFYLDGAQDRCGATLLPIWSHAPAPYRPSTLIFHMFHSPLLHSSFTPRKSTHTMLSVSLLLHLFSLIRAGIEPHPGPVQDPCSVWRPGTRQLGRLFMYGVRPVLPPPLLQDLIPSRQQSTGGWPRGAAPHAPHQSGSHLQHPSGVQEESSVLERTCSTLASRDSLSQRSLTIGPSGPPTPDEHCCSRTCLRERQVPAVQLQQHPPLPRRTAGLPASSVSSPGCWLQP